MNAEAIRPYFLLAILLGIGGLTFFIFRPFLAPLLLAAVFSIVLYPIFSYCRKKTGNYPGVAALLTVLFSSIVILIPLFILGTLIFSQAADLYVSLSSQEGRTYFISAAERTLALFEGYIPGIERIQNTLVTNIGSYAENGLAIVVSHLGAILSGISGFFLSLFIFFIALYYFLKEGGKIKRFMLAVSPLSDRDDESVFNRLERAVNSVIKGNLLIAIAQGFVSGIGLTIFGVPNSILWGMVTAFAALIPGIGTALVLGPAVLYLFLAGSTASAIGLLFWGIAAVGLVDNLLGPKLLGRGLSLHPLLVLLSVLGGLAFFGAIGIFLGPLTLSLLFALLSLYSESSKKKEQGTVVS